MNYHDIGYPYDSGGLYVPFWSEGDVSGGGSVSTSGYGEGEDADLPREFCIGFHVAAPGPSRKPRVRVKAGSRKAGAA